MIPQPSVLAWERERAPWSEDWQIEHDLMMSRVLIEIFSHQSLSGRLIFRGGPLWENFTLIHRIGFQRIWIWFSLNRGRLNSRFKNRCFTT